LRALNLRVIVLTCLVTLGVALSAHYLIYHYKVTDPLLEQIAQLTGVNDVSLETIGNRRYIVLDLSVDANLPDIYSAASKHGAQTFGKRFAGVIIHDNRSSVLNESYYQMQFHIQQGIATGLFTQMVDGVDQLAAQAQLESYRVYVDADYIYLHLVKDGCALFELIPRSPKTAAAASFVGGYAS
jgi:hypothetical protein